MVRIPRYEEYAAEKELQSTSRIPDTRMTGAIAVGEAMQSLGSAVKGFGGAAGSFLKARANVQEKNAAFNADVELLKYQQAAAMADENAAVKANVDQTGYHDAGVQYLTPYAQGLNKQIADLEKNGYTDAANELRLKKTSVDLQTSTRLRATEFKNVQQSQLDHIVKRGELSLNYAGDDPAMNDRIRGEFQQLVDDATHLTPAQKEALRAAQSTEVLKREVELISKGNPEQVAQTLGLPRPGAGNKQVLYDAVSASGGDAGAAMAIAEIENGGSWREDQPGPSTSSAWGLVQGTDAWNSDYGSYRGAPAAVQAQAMARAMADYEARVQASAGREATMADLYLMHNMGKNAGAKFAALPDDMPLTTALVSAGAAKNTVENNPKIYGGVTTVGELRAKTEALMAAAAGKVVGDETMAASFNNTPDVDRLRSKITYDLAGKVRDQKPQEYVVLRAQAAVEKVSPDYRIIVHSGMGEHGSDRHREVNGGRAADIYVVDGSGKKVSYADNPEAVRAVYKALAASGMKGLGFYGAGNPSIHVDDVRASAWGPDTKGASLPPDIKAAIDEGRAMAGSGVQFQQQGAGNPRYANLTLGERQKIYDDTVAQQNATYRETEDQRTAYQTSVYDGMYQRITTKNAVVDPTEIDSLDLGAKEKQQLKNLYDNERKDERLRNDAFAALQLGQEMPKDGKDEKAAAEAAFAQRYPDVGQMIRDPRAQQKLAEDISVTGYMPKSLTQGATQAFDRQDAASFANYMDVLANLAINRPELFPEGQSQLETMARVYDEYAEVNGREAAAAAVMQEYHAASTKDVEQLRSSFKTSEAYKPYKGVTGIQAAFADSLGVSDTVGAVDSFSTLDPEAPTAQMVLVADKWNTIVEQEFIKNRGLHPDKIVANAKRQFVKYFGVSNVGGTPELMAYPPEQNFPAQVTYVENAITKSITPVESHDYIKTQALEAIQTSGSSFLEDLTFEAVDGETARGAQTVEALRKKWADPASRAELQAIGINSESDIYRRVSIPYRVSWTDKNGLRQSAVLDPMPPDDKTEAMKQIEQINKLKATQAARGGYFGTLTEEELQKRMENPNEVMRYMRKAVKGAVGIARSTPEMLDVMGSAPGAAAAREQEAQAGASAVEAGRQRIIQDNTPAPTPAPAPEPAKQWTRNIKPWNEDNIGIASPNSPLGRAALEGRRRKAEAIIASQPNYGIAKPNSPLGRQITAGHQKQVEEAKKYLESLKKK
jgi:hypothetical protein